MQRGARFDDNRQVANGCYIPSMMARRFWRQFSFLLGIVLVLFCGAASGIAQQSGRADIAELLSLLAVEQTVLLQREEGLDQGAALGLAMLPQQMHRDWAEIVSAIYEPNQMADRIKDALEKTLSADDLDLALAFYRQPNVQLIVDAEVTARWEMRDHRTDAASRGLAVLEALEATPRYRLIESHLLRTGRLDDDLAHAMNSGLAFYLGMAQANRREPYVLDDITDAVWAQEPDLRLASAEWTYAYLLRAYALTEPEALDAYLSFQQSPTGQGILLAFRQAEADVDVQNARSLGQALARQIVDDPL